MSGGMPPLDLERTALVVVGVATNVCVAGMARELADADFDAYVVEDACATIGEAAHISALKALEATFAFVFGTAEGTDLLRVSNSAPQRQ